jgi:NADH-quinone oxidoreductase subunit N
MQPLGDSSVFSPWHPGIFSLALYALMVLVLIAMFNVVISLYYYLRVLKAAYLTEPAAPLPTLVMPVAERMLTYLLIGAIVLLGFYPRGLLQIAAAAARALS